eukprot:CAMPEP_0183744364 /NCGR_PEP_ID=MMETSP0737-20130205/65691_1 /TAXON_ID=385413 /ORGANISM="Thalassiosira miniscula, Strain CCMP1093" /LENGTH=1442 /DNA_ID=CAMNT_0025980005 /DNA_START=145 /DNA_END=4473 /DNA_ORIENTATION=-
MVVEALSGAPREPEDAPIVEKNGTSSAVANTTIETNKDANIETDAMTASTDTTSAISSSEASSSTSAAAAAATPQPLPNLSSSSSTPKKKQYRAPSPPRWRFVKEAKSTMGYSSMAAGTYVRGKSSQELGAAYVPPQIKLSKRKSETPIVGDLDAPNLQFGDYRKDGENSVGRLSIDESLHENEELFEGGIAISHDRKETLHKDKRYREWNNLYPRSKDADRDTRKDTIDKYNTTYQHDDASQFSHREVGKLSFHPDNSVDGSFVGEVPKRKIGNVIESEDSSGVAATSSMKDDSNDDRREEEEIAGEGRGDEPSQSRNSNDEMSKEPSVDDNTSEDDPLRRRRKLLPFLLIPFLLVIAGTVVGVVMTRKDPPPLEENTRVFTSVIIVPEEVTSQPSTQPSSTPSDDIHMGSSHIGMSEHLGVSETTTDMHQPSTSPSAYPSFSPRVNIFDVSSTPPPTAAPSKRPSARPSNAPSGLPSSMPSSLPSIIKECPPSFLSYYNYAIGAQVHSQGIVYECINVSCSGTLGEGWSFVGTCDTTAPTHSPSMSPSTTELPSSSPSNRPSTKRLVFIGECPESFDSLSIYDMGSQVHSQGIVYECIRISCSGVAPGYEPPGWRAEVWDGIGTCETKSPTRSPSLSPSNAPTTQRPSTKPSASPTSSPSKGPTRSPSTVPSRFPSSSPSRSHSEEPSLSLFPTMQPIIFLGACPQEFVPMSYYHIGTKVQLQGIVYECIDWSCGTFGFDPGLESGKWKDAWLVLGSCSGTLQPTLQPTASPSATPTNVPTSSPTMQPIVFLGACPQEFVPMSYYHVGTKVQLQGIVYECIDWSCGTFGFDPGLESGKWKDAWLVLGSCSGTLQPTLQPTASPSATPTNVPTSSPTMQPIVFLGACPQEFVPMSYYHVGTKVQLQGIVYECIDWSCGTFGFDPGSEAGRWKDAWEVLGSCSGTLQPTISPTRVLSTVPSLATSNIPSSPPTSSPSKKPSQLPSSTPSRSPTIQPTPSPSRQPSQNPTSAPSKSPSSPPTSNPSNMPSRFPTSTPSRAPFNQPTSSPSQRPSQTPTSTPSKTPSDQPTSSPSERPSQPPSSAPSKSPSGRPTTSPSKRPSQFPTSAPSKPPSNQPTSSPSKEPSQDPTFVPSKSPSSRPTLEPTDTPTLFPTDFPTVTPTDGPIAQPTFQPTLKPTADPTRKPTSDPTSPPTFKPTLLDLTTPAPTCAENGNFNLCVAIDMSGSVCNGSTKSLCLDCQPITDCNSGGEKLTICCPNFFHVREFTKDLVTTLGELPTKQDFSVVHFGTEVTVASTLESWRQSIKTLNTLEYTGGMTNLAGAISSCQLTLNQSPPDRKNIMLIITDGAPSVPSSLISAQNAARNEALDAENQDTFIIPVLIEEPDENSQGEVDFLSNSISTDGKVFVSDFDGLQNIEQSVFDQVTCQAKPKDVGGGEDVSNGD